MLTSLSTEREANNPMWYSPPLLGLVALVWGCCQAGILAVAIRRRRLASPDDSLSFLAGPRAPLLVGGVGVVVALGAFALMSLSVRVTQTSACGVVLAACTFQLAVGILVAKLAPPSRRRSV